MDTNDCLEKFKNINLNDNKDIHILLLGETGVGKSTFINALANYLQFKKLKRAEKTDLLILIPSTITVTDSETLQPRTVTVGSTDKNEYQETGASATQGVKTYIFPIGEGKTRLRLIDTPGMGDTRGVKQDEKNCENILNHIGELKDLHAICFLMKPTTTRITAYFEYCMKQILSRLEKSASKNIIFIFTNTRGTNYTAGDTLPCLQKIINDIQARPPHVQIQLKTNVFSFDNEAFRYLVSIKNGIKMDDQVRQRFLESWKHSSNECWRLISYIVGDSSTEPLKPHNLQYTVSINEARRMIVQLAQPLADITQLIYDNIRILERHQHNLRGDYQSMEELKQKMFIPIVNLEVTKLTQPVTVCASAKCAEVYKVGDLNKWHYTQRCHDPCYLANVPKEMMGDPHLVNCEAMSNGRTCKKCTCDYTVHMHVYYMTKTVNDQIEDKTVRSNIVHKERALVEAQRLIREIDRRKLELGEERVLIIKNSAQFAHFLQNNAITPYNDSYKSYIQYLIKREQSMGRIANCNVIYDLKQLLKKYDAIKAVFDESLALHKGLGIGNESVVTANTIFESISKLYTLKHNGKKIRELFDTQKTCKSTENDKNCEYIHPNASTVQSEKKNKKKVKAKSKTDDERSKEGTDSDTYNTQNKSYATDTEQTQKKYKARNARTANYRGSNMHHRGSNQQVNYGHNQHNGYDPNQGNSWKYPNPYYEQPPSYSDSETRHHGLLPDPKVYVNIEYGGRTYDPSGGAPHTSRPHNEPNYGDPYGGPPLPRQYADPYGGLPFSSPYGGPPFASPYGGPPFSSPYGGPPFSSPYGGPPFSSPYVVPYRESYGGHPPPTPYAESPYRGSYRGAPPTPYNRPNRGSFEAPQFKSRSYDDFYGLPLQQDEPFSTLNSQPIPQVSRYIRRTNNAGRGRGKGPIKQTEKSRPQPKREQKSGKSSDSDSSE